MKADKLELQILNNLKFNKDDAEAIQDIVMTMNRQLN